MPVSPLVSILIPAYNSGKWIKQTIESALAQTWKNKELIIVDDGSKDDTYKIARRFESGNVKVLTQSNRGASAARNKAFNLAQGDFIQWLDSDDILAPNKIELQLKKGGFDPETKILHSSAWGFFYYSIRRAKFERNSLWQDLSPKEWLMHHLGDGFFMFPAVWLVSRKLSKLNGPWDERLSLNDDGEYFCRAVSNSDNVCFTNEAISYHRVGNSGSLSRSEVSNKALKSLSLSINLCVDYLLKLENSDSTRKICIESLQAVANNPSGTHPDIVNSNQKRIIELGGIIEPVKQSRKFRLAQNILGVKKASVLKNSLWNLEILSYKYWDRLLHLMHKEII